MWYFPKKDISSISQFCILGSQIAPSDLHLGLTPEGGQPVLTGLGPLRTHDRWCVFFCNLPIPYFSILKELTTVDGQPLATSFHPQYIPVSSDIQLDNSEYANLSFNLKVQQYNALEFVLILVDFSTTLFTDWWWNRSCRPVRSSLAVSRKIGELDCGLFSLDGGPTDSRFPCCVLSYFSLVFVMEHWQLNHWQLTNPSHKSQLSRAIN